MKNPISKPLKSILASLCALLGLVANNAQADLWFHINGTSPGYGVVNNSTYSWDTTDSNVWATAAGAAPTTTWVAGNFARFDAGAANYTLTVGTDVGMAGCYVYYSTNHVSINQAAGTGGDLNLPLGSTTASYGGYNLNVQGFLCGGYLVINAPIVGVGGIQHSVSLDLSLYGTNSYQGGTWTTGGQLIYYNNNNSFGTGPIYVGGSGDALVATIGASSITITNPVLFPTANYFINLAGGNVGTSPGTIFAGPFILAGSGTNGIGTSSSASQIIQISGNISGSAGLRLYNAGTAILSGTNTYSGATVIANTATLRQGVANAIPYGSGKGNLSITNASGTLDLGGFNCNLNGFGNSVGIIDNKTGGGNVTLTIGNNNGGGTHSGPIKNTTGTLALVKTGTGTTTLSGSASTYNGHTTITGGGVLQIQADGSLGTAPASPTVDITLDGSCLKNNNSTPTLSANRTIQLTTHGGYLDAGFTAKTVTIGGQITGSGFLAIDMDSSPVQLKNAGNNWTGPTYIGTNGPGYSAGGSAAWLQLGASGVLPNGTGYGDVYIYSAYKGKLDLGGFNATINGLWGDGAAAVVDNTVGGASTLTVGNNDVSSMFAGTIQNTAGTVAINKMGAGTLTLSGVNTYTGGTTISAGTLHVSGSLAGNVTNNAGVLQLDNASALSITSALVLPGSPSGNLALNFSGNLVIQGGLYFGTTLQAQGVYGSLANTTPGIIQTAAITGPGLLIYTLLPIVVQQPQSVTTFTNCAATFFVGAVGAPPLAYQWCLSASPVTGATNSTYSLNNVQHANAGSYTCVITNTYGATTSAVATLTVKDTATTDIYANTILADQPMAYYRLDETIGSLHAVDIVGSYNGVYNNVTLGQAGFTPIDSDTAASFGPGLPSSPASYVGSISNISFAASSSTTAFSLEVWVNGSSSQTSGAGIIAKGAGGGGEQFNLDVFNGVYRFFVRDSTTNTTHGLSATVGPNGTWQHIVAVYDGANTLGTGSLVYLYVNGQSAANPAAAGAAGILTSSHEIAIGARQSGSTAYDLNFKGTLDEVAIYGKALSSSQVQAHYQAQYNWPGFPAVLVSGPTPSAISNIYPRQCVSTNFSVVVAGDLSTMTYQWYQNGNPITGASSSSYSPNGGNGIWGQDAGTYYCAITNTVNGNPSGLVSPNATLSVLPTNNYVAAILCEASLISYWRLDETNGTTAHDLVGGNNGTYTNVILNQTPGYSPIDSNPCVDLQKMPKGQGSYVSIANYSAFDFFKKRSAFTLEGWIYVTNMNGSVQRLFSTDQINAPGGYMCGISGPNGLVFTTSGYNDYPVTLSTPLQAKVWYHIVFGFDGATFHYYVNGQSVGALTLHDNGGTNGAPMCLGANGDFLTVNGNDNSEQLQGKLDECAIYGTFLGDSEIQQHYLASLPVVPMALPPVADFPTNYVSLTTTLTENAVGQNLTYQWYYNGSRISGATDSSYAISPLQPSGSAGTYTVRLTNSVTGDFTNPPGVAVTVLPIPTSAGDLNLTNGLVLHLPLAADYNDISGHNNNGTAVGSPTLTTGSGSGAIVGNGYLTYSSTVGGPYNYVTLDKPSDLVFGATGTFSVAFWVRQSGYFTNLPFFGNAVGSTARSSQGFALAPGLDPSFGTPNGSWAWGMSDGAGNFGAVGNANDISDGNWHHLVFVFDRSSTASTYLDGVLQDARNDSFFGSVDSGQVFNIGQDPTGSFPATAGADMDDLGVWRRALTPVEISGMYLAAKNNNVSFALAAPKAYNVTGASTCSGGSVTVVLSGSDTGVNYQLYLNGSTAVGSPIPGTGSALTFAVQTAIGTYTVVATDTTTLYTANMLGSVSVWARPTAYTVTGGGCAASGVGLSGSETNKSYQLYVNPGSGPFASGSPVKGTGSAINFGLQTTAGTYTVLATDTNTSCTELMTGGVVVNASPNAFNVTLSGTAVGLISSQSGKNYQLYRDGSTAVGSPVPGTGSAITFGNQSPGTYTVVATDAFTGCTASMTGSVTVTALLPVRITSFDGTTISYSGGAGSQFVLLQSAQISAPLSSWARVNTNTATSGTFIINATGPQAFYSIKSE